MGIADFADQQSTQSTPHQGELASVSSWERPGPGSSWDENSAASESCTRGVSLYDEALAGLSHGMHSQEPVSRAGRTGTGDSSHPPSKDLDMIRRSFGRLSAGLTALQSEFAERMERARCGTEAAEAIDEFYKAADQILHGGSHANFLRTNSMDSRSPHSLASEGCIQQAESVHSNKSNVMDRSSSSGLGRPSAMALSLALQRVQCELEDG